MRQLQITCANKNQQGTIVRLGGDQWSLSRHELITRLMTESHEAHILIGNENFLIGVRQNAGAAFLVLEPDGTPLDEVAGLRSC